MSPPAERSPAASNEIAQLRDEVTDLKNQVQVLSDILDEIRVDLQWVAQNGLPIGESLPACPTLKRMALDPCADDWNERLVIDYGPLPRAGALTAEAASSTPAGRSQEKVPSEHLVASTGSQRQLF